MTKTHQARAYQCSIRNKKIRHPKYQEDLPYFDVAVLTLDGPADIDGFHVRTICVPAFALPVLDLHAGDQVSKLR